MYSVSIVYTFDYIIVKGVDTFPHPTKCAVTSPHFQGYHYVLFGKLCTTQCVGNTWVGHFSSGWNRSLLFFPGLICMQTPIPRNDGRPVQYARKSYFSSQFEFYFYPCFSGCPRNSKFSSNEDIGGSSAICGLHGNSSGGLVGCAGSTTSLDSRQVSVELARDSRGAYCKVLFEFSSGFFLQKWCVLYAFSVWLFFSSKSSISSEWKI